jgi:hypothetical protein
VSEDGVETFGSYIYDRADHELMKFVSVEPPWLRVIRPSGSSALIPIAGIAPLGNRFFVRRAPKGNEHG